MPYVDGYVMPVPTRNVAEYRRLARIAAKVWREHGALEYRECIGDDLDIKSGINFRKMTRGKPRETVVFAWIVFRSRAHRDRVNAKVLADRRMVKMMTLKPPFDANRMAFGGFRMIVDA